MNNKVIISVVVTVIILGGLAGYALFAPKGSQQPSPAPIAATPEPTPTPISGQKSLKELLSLGQSVKCTFSDSMSSVATQGTVYVGNQKMKGDFSSMTGGKTTMSHILVDSPTSYFWTDGSTVGMKMNLSASAMPSASVNNKGVDVDKKMDFKCDSWVVDNSVFTLPKEVKFSELTIPTGTKSSSGSGQVDVKAMQCASCNSLPAASQAQCKAALSCL